MSQNIIPDSQVMLQRSSTFDGIAFVIQWRNTSFSLSLLWKRAKLSRLLRSVRSGAAVAKSHLSANVYGRHIQEVDLIFRQMWRFSCFIVAAKVFPAWMYSRMPRQSSCLHLPDTVARLERNERTPENLED